MALSCLAAWDGAVPLDRGRAGMAVGINQKVKHKEVLPGEDLTLVFVCNGHGEASPGLSPLELFKGFLAVLAVLHLEPKPPNLLPCAVLHKDFGDFGHV